MSSLGFRVQGLGVQTPERLGYEGVLYGLVRGILGV